MWPITATQMLKLWLELKETFVFCFLDINLCNNIAALTYSYVSTIQNIFLFSVLDVTYLYESAPSCISTEMLCLIQNLCVHV